MLTNQNLNFVEPVFLNKRKAILRARRSTEALKKINSIREGIDELKQKLDEKEKFHLKNIELKNTITETINAEHPNIEEMDMGQSREKV